MKIIQVKDYEKLSELACNVVCKHLKENKKTVLGLPTGSTPIGMYKALIQLYQKDNNILKNVITFNLDEYIGLEKNHPQSYHNFMFENFFDYVNIPEENIHIPKANTSYLNLECDNYEQKIDKLGPIDLQILGIGENGHIGFNEPNTPFDSLTHIVQLDEITRKSNARFFNSLEEVPKQAITMGIKTIMKSEEILLLVSGKNKQKTLDIFLNKQITESFPASILHKHKNVTVVTDLEIWFKKEGFFWHTFSTKNAINVVEKI